jgi:hypothetical protein
MKRIQWKKISRALHRTFVDEQRKQTTGVFCDQRGKYCFMGGLLHGAGLTDEQIATMTTDDQWKAVMETEYGLDFSFTEEPPRGGSALFWKISHMNDTQRLSWSEIYAKLPRIIREIRKKQAKGKRW